MTINTKYDIGDIIKFNKGGIKLGEIISIRLYDNHVVYVVTDGYYISEDDIVKRYYEDDSAGGAS